MAKENKPATPGPLVEDAQSVGGVDADTGAPVVKAKTVEGKADESVIPTDRRELPKGWSQGKNGTILTGTPKVD